MILLVPKQMWSRYARISFVENFKLNNYTHWKVFISSRVYSCYSGKAFEKQVKLPLTVQLPWLPFSYRAYKQSATFECTASLTVSLVVLPPPWWEKTICYSRQCRSDELPPAPSWLIHLQQPLTWGGPYPQPTPHKQRQQTYNAHVTPNKCDHLREEISSVT